MAEKILIYYLGDDESYFRALQGECRAKAKTTIEFLQLYESDEAQIQTLFIQIFKANPACVIIDFSKQTNEYLHLARLLSRTPSETPKLLVGLVDYLSPAGILKEGLLTGCQLCYIKSAEIFDVAYGIFKNIAPGAIGEHGFAQAVLKEEIDAGILSKVGYIHPAGIHIETDYPLSKGDWLDIDHFWETKKMVPSKKVFVQNVTDRDLFYQFKLNADLTFLFEDDIIPFEGMSQELMSARFAEREDAIRYDKKKLKNWIEDHKMDSSPKRAKVLVVDESFRFYQDQPRADKHPYTIRCIPYFLDIEEELLRMRPQIIVFEIQKVENARNTMESLGELIKIQKPMLNEGAPYIIVFNSPVDSAQLQTMLQYPQVLAHDGELSPEIVIKIADALQKKLSNQKATEDETHKLFLKKNHPSSIVEIKRSVTLIKISETDMILRSDLAFNEGANLHITKPIEMYVSIKPNPKPSGKTPEFYGIIHSIGENEKKELRRYVNAIFFRDHDAQLSAETEEFKKLNEKKLQEKINQAVKSQEEKLNKALKEEESKARKAAAAAAVVAPVPIETEEE